MFSAPLRRALLGALLAAPVVAQAQTQERVTADVTTNTTWTADREWLLDGLIFVDGATLTIEPGTVVRGVRDDRITTGDAASGLIVRRGAKIMADGTAAAPIIFTAEDDDLSDPTDFTQRDRGEWAGIIVLGRATTNQPTTDNQIEGILPAAQGGDEALYGGTDDDDDSGVLRYVSVRHSGVSITGQEGAEIQGITLGGVGRGTTIEYVEIFASADDGIEWFGGTVDVKYAAVAFPFDDAFDYDQGWDGRGQFWFTIADTDAAGRGGEHDGGDDGGDDATPFATPVISNVTYIGAGSDDPTNADSDQNDYAFRMRDGAGGYYFNSIFTAYPDRAIDIENFEAAATFDSFQQYQDGNLQIENNLFFDFGRGTSVDDITDANYSDETVSNPAAGDADDDAFATYVGDNNTVADPQLGAISRTDDNGLDPRPSTGGPAASGADFDFDELDDWFTEVDYLGAFVPSDGAGDATWLAGWTALAQTGFLTGFANAAVNGPEAATFELTVGPNPARDNATVRFSLAEAQDVRIALYDVLGREVAVVAEGAFGAGPQAARLETASLPAGLYVLRLDGEAAAASRQISVVR